MTSNNRNLEQLTNFDYRKILMFLCIIYLNRRVPTILGYDQQKQ